MNNNDKIKNVLEETLENFSVLTDADVVVGTPIKTESGALVLPVTKTTVAFLSGGGEYGEVKLFQPNKNYPLSSGSGGFITVKPYGFIVEERGRIKYIACPEDNIEKLFGDVLSVIRDINEKN